MAEQEKYQDALDGYVFMRGASKAYLDDLILQAAEYKRVRYVAAISGEYDAIAAVTFWNGLSDLEASAHMFRTNPNTITAVGVHPRAPDSLKWSISFPFEAFVRVWVNPGSAFDTADFLGDASNVPGTEGATAVAADFDVLAGVGADDWDGLIQNLLVVNGAPNIVRTATHFVLRSSERPQGPPSLGGSGDQMA
jgi:hypothetical protein